jgi:hypothetical protein
MPILQDVCNENKLTLQQNVLLDKMYVADLYIPELKHAIQPCNSFAYFAKTNILSQELHEKHMIMSRQAHLEGRNLQEYSVWAISAESLNHKLKDEEKGIEQVQQLFRRNFEQRLKK